MEKICYFCFIDKYSYVVLLIAIKSVYYEFIFVKTNNMSGILFEKVIFGPIHSRRLGNSLGINLMPEEIKLCTFNCIYCECGWSKTDKVLFDKLLTANTIIPILEQRFKELYDNKTQIDSITYSGNGEPTLHPEFEQITLKIMELRDKYFPKTIISCLTNSTRLACPEVMRTLQRIDNPLLKLDAGTQTMFDAINKPFEHINIEDITDKLCQFNGNLTIQTLFLRGENNGIKIDNTTEYEVQEWLKRIERIHPHTIMLYPIDRETPEHSLVKVMKNELELIAKKVQQLGIKTLIY